MWLLSDGLKELVREWWTGYLVAETNNHCLAEKLKSLKKDLKRWNKEVFGNVSIRKSEVLFRIQLWDSKERVNPLSFEEAEARMRDLEEYKNCVLMEETSWRQKSRETWLKEGDKNTSFFHKMANARAKRKFLSKVKINGVTLIDEEDIKSRMCRAYRTLLLENADWRLRNGDLQFHVLGTERSRSLEVPFSEEEVFEALCNLFDDKTPCPDDFTMTFWQSSWEFTKGDIMVFFGDFFLLGTFQRSLNSIFLVLIPKKGGTEELKDFRSINLVGSLYKLLAKVLANRLKLVVGKVVSKFQHAFIQDRQILDVALIAN
ncbi:Transposon TX1 uncharacterized 149 kDa protein [Vitis vinifera]|uniref:Transposon TX1 uncharacterized 149 kDa protein n=1 Tax=Vitis vinifera TaxID=29760 RepID=A0A438C3C5_VITVI|nr:Transposon TX1 uncharacterized 149 kDa protein [Vitis vinifera]